MLQEFVQQVKNTVYSVMAEMHTAIPGRVVSYNPATCLATIQPIGKFVTPKGEKIAYPQLTEVPFCFPYSAKAGCGIAVPVEVGDTCLVIFSEIELDEWRSGAVADLEGSLKFDLTNAIAIPGLLQTSNALSQKAAADKAVVVGAGSTILSVSKSGVKVHGSLTVTGTVYAGKVEATTVDATNGNLTNVSATKVDTGTVNATGAISAASVSASGDVTAGGTSLKNHSHPE